MAEFYNILPVWLWGAAFGVAFLAGFVKGVVGFALPLVMVSGLGAFATPELALAGLILPTVVTNIMQAFRHGVASAAQSARQFRWFLVFAAIALLASAQIVPIVPQRVYLHMLGVPLVLYIISQFAGWTPVQVKQRVRFDIVVGTIAGFFAGIAGVWGPPTVAYLTALNIAKATQVQIQGVIYLSGAIFLVLGHLLSGILTVQTSLFSLCLVPTAIVGMIVGTKVQDRIDQTTFRRATLFVLLIAGLNLVRRGIMA